MILRSTNEASIINYALSASNGVLLIIRITLQRSRFTPVLKTDGHYHNPAAVAPSAATTEQVMVHIKRS